MKTIMFLLRYLCLMALILVVVYAPDALLYGSSGSADQMPCYETVGRVWSQWLEGSWYREAWFLITAAVLLILAFARGVTAIWNVLYALSLILMLAAGSLFFINLPLALPSAIGNMPELQFLPTLYRTEAALVSFIPVVFILGLLLSSARVRIFLYTVICYTLWYGLSELFTYLLDLWQQAETPFMPELLAFLYDTRWLLVALIGAFLLVYDIILAFTETFTKPAPNKLAEDKKDGQKAGQNKEVGKAQGATAPAATTAAASQPKAGTTPAPAPKPAASAAPAAATKPATGSTTPKPAPQPAAKPAAAGATPKLVTTPAPAPKPATAKVATATKPAVITVHKVAPTLQPEATPAPAPSTTLHNQADTETHPQPESTPQPEASPQAAVEVQSAAMPEPTVTSSTVNPAAVPPPAPMPIAQPFAPTDEKLDDSEPLEEAPEASAEGKEEASDAAASPAESAAPAEPAPEPSAAPAPADPAPTEGSEAAAPAANASEVQTSAPKAES